MHLYSSPSNAPPTILTCPPFSLHSCAFSSPMRPLLPLDDHCLYAQAPPLLSFLMIVVSVPMCPLLFSLMTIASQRPCALPSPLSMFIAVAVMTTPHHSCRFLLSRFKIRFSY
ncbi:hypothetical protein L484_000273 [Morus notabilis]|uniref:Uncharacterized protein n=1 Tax=Morus notabilis TaxID=981085 RepID=W9SP36_9ROSA|nr:hypothetical protein L484_000273 [Morus notabilis]